MIDLPEVRIAEPGDEQEIMEMCQNLHRENGLFSYNETKVRECLHKCYGRKGSIVGVIGAPGHIEASICLMISDFYYTDDWHLAELWNYVDPTYRRSRNAEALIEFGKGCAEKMGVPFFTGIITNSHMAGKVRLYRRRLGYPTGAFFIHNGNFKPDEVPEPETHDDLRKQLIDFADRYADKKIPREIVREVLFPLLKEAAAVIKKIGREDDFWPPLEKNESHHMNGSG